MSDIYTDSIEDRIKELETIVDDQQQLIVSMDQRLAIVEEQANDLQQQIATYGTWVP